jgi:hypothetical protein
MLLTLLLCLSLGLWRALPVVAQEPPKPLPEVQALLDQGSQALLLSRQDEAARLYEQALQQARELKDRKGEAPPSTASASSILTWGSRSRR